MPTHPRETIDEARARLGHEAWVRDRAQADIDGDQELADALDEIGVKLGYPGAGVKGTKRETANDSIRRAARDKVTDIDVFRRRARDTSDR